MLLPGGDYDLIRGVSILHVEASPGVVLGTLAGSSVQANNVDVRCRPRSGGFYYASSGASRGC